MNGEESPRDDSSQDCRPGPTNTVHQPQSGSNWRTAWGESSLHLGGGQGGQDHIAPELCTPCQAAASPHCGACIRSLHQGKPWYKQQPTEAHGTATCLIPSPDSPHCTSVVAKTGEWGLMGQLKHMQPLCKNNQHLQACGVCLPKHLLEAVFFVNTVPNFPGIWSFVASIALRIQE